MSARGNTAVLKTSYAEILQTVLKRPILSTKEKQIATLWQGYGQVSRLTLQVQSADDAGCAENVDLIVKSVNPPKASGISHQRKLHSYQVEAYFYEHVAPDLQSAASKVPLPYYIECSDKDKFTFILEDLSVAYPTVYHTLDLVHTKSSLRWLAAFHAQHWELETPGNLWEQGTFWYLDTRTEEFAKISKSMQHVKDVAKYVDKRLKGYDANGCFSPRHRTLVHGDFKSENLAFNSTNAECSAYDFQYCGGGYGVRDISYLFVSSVEQEVIETHEQELLQYYYKHLLEFLRVLGKPSSSYTFSVLLEHYELSLVDFLRFMAGWGYWGNSTWAKSRAKHILSKFPSMK